MTQRIDKGQGRWRRPRDLVVIEDDDVDALTSEQIDRVGRGGSAIHCQQQAGWILAKAILRGFTAKAVAFFLSARQVMMGLPTEAFEDFQQ